MEDERVDQAGQLGVQVSQSLQLNTLVGLYLQFD